MINIYKELGKNKKLKEYGFKPIYPQFKVYNRLVKIYTKGENMEEKQKGAAPDFKAVEGVAVWKKKDKNGKTYLSISILGNINVNAFAYEPKEKPKGDL